MRVVVLHLSDFHITDSTSPLLGRSEQIARSVVGLEAEIDACVIAATGDIAFSGLEEEYALAHDFLAELVKHLRLLLPWRVGAQRTPHVVLCPGNHDCNFGSDEVRKTREMVLNGLRTERSLANNRHALDLCLEPQKAFRDFYEAAATATPFPASAQLPSTLCYQVVVPVGTRQLRVISVNSAWSSTKKEVPGTLMFPAAELTLERLPHCDATLVLLHHPYNWFDPTLARKLRASLECVASVILTGHEHVTDSYVKTPEAGETVEFIEGGALAEHGSSQASEFNALLLDLGTSQQKLLHLAWDGTHYTSARLDDPEAEWRPFLGLQQQSARGLTFTPEHAAYLDDPGVLLRYRAKEAPTLRDIFVYPDVRRIDPRADPSTTTIIPGDRLVNEIAQLRHVLLSGDSESGRTSTAKVLCHTFREKGKVPILLSPEAAPPPAGTAHSWVLSAARRQYGATAEEVLRSLSPSERVIIVDDFHRLQLKPSRRRQLIESLCSLAEIVVVTAHDLAIDAEEIDEEQRLVPEVLQFANLRLLPMGHVKRDELVTRMLRLGQGDTEEEPDAFAARRHKVMGVLDTLLGTRFVPSYPIYILIVLQSEEANQPLDPQASTYGHFYELMIKIGLLGGRSGAAYEFRSALLSTLAHEFFLASRRLLPHSRLVATVARFLKERDLARDPETVLQSLLDGQMLQRRGGDLSFRYPYIYYYFAAIYLREHIAEAESRTTISTMCSNLHVEDYHGVLLFLAHLTQDRFVIGEILRAAERVFPGAKEARLEEDVEFLGRLNEELVRGQLRFEDRSAEDARREAMADLDEGGDDLSAASWQDEADPKERTAASDFLGTLTVGLRTLQLLGQVLRNFAGSLKGDEKLEMARNCYGIGLRILTSFFGLVEGHEREQIQGWAEVLRKHFPRIREEELFRRAAGTIAGLSFLMCLGTILRISSAVGSEELAVTHQRLRGESPSAAYMLIDAAISLGRSREPSVAEVEQLATQLRENLVGSRMLQVLVLRHFHLFDVRTKTKQRLCSALGIEFKGLGGERATQRLIGPGSPGHGSSAS